MFKYSLISAAILVACSSPAFAADKYNYQNEVNLEITEAIPEYSSITADASNLVFKEMIGESGSVFETDNGTVSVTNKSNISFEKGLHTSSSGASSNGLYLSGNSSVTIHGDASFKTSGYQGSAVVVEDNSRLNIIGAESFAISSSGKSSNGLVVKDSAVAFENSTGTLSSNSTTGILLQNSTLELNQASSLNTNDRSTELENSQLSLASSTFSTNTLKGTGNIDAVSDAELTVKKLTLTGDLNIANSQANIANATVDKGTLSLSGDSTYEGTSLNLTDTNLIASGEEGQSIKLEKLTGENVRYTLGDTESSINIGNSEVTNLTLVGSGTINDSVSGDAEKAKQYFGIREGNQGNQLLMLEGMYEGETLAVFDENNKLVSQTIKTNTLMESTLELASAAPLAMNRIMMSNLRKRMGDIRTDTNTNGAWARYEGGRLSGSNGLENDFNTIQVGGDMKLGDWRVGGAFNYTKGDVDYARGDADMDAYGLSAYGLWLGSQGQFVDIVARVSKADTDMTVDGYKTGSMDSMAYSLSGEFGWRFALSDMVYIEPQVEAAYTYVDADDADIGTASYKFDSVNSFIGRAGFATGIKCPSNFGDVYFHASALHEFSGDSEITGGNGSKYSVDGKDTWFEYGIGANFNINKATYVWADVQRTSGADLDEDWRANIGVRYSF